MAAKTITKDSAKVPVEVKRLNEEKENIAPWKKWGPYLSERQWGL
jgi:hypothetical protein